LFLRWAPVNDGIRWLRGNGRLEGSEAKVKITITLFFSADDL
jgi:hypothetical protein